MSVAHFRGTFSPYLEMSFHSGLNRPEWDEQTDGRVTSFLNITPYREDL